LGTTANQGKACTRSWADGISHLLILQRFDVQISFCSTDDAMVDGSGLMPIPCRRAVWTTSINMHSSTFPLCLEPFGHPPTHDAWRQEN
jgi:hypothetical protein